ncbi:hypothetical protein V6M83_00345, partial [Streptococcus anginosus]|uniref:hypothetical protein n=1 Tax=Streptococcus anginosus TaxID=1328 RepID=UPI002FF3B9E1
LKLPRFNPERPAAEELQERAEAGLEKKRLVLCYLLGCDFSKKVKINLKMGQMWGKIYFLVMCL